MKRLYEWRRGDGQRYGEPRLAENACHFRALSIANGFVVVIEPAAPAPNATQTPLGPERVLNAFVVGTGEKVITEVSACRTKVRLEAGFAWFNAAGREVAP